MFWSTSESQIKLCVLWLALQGSLVNMEMLEPEVASFYAGTCSLFYAA